VKGVIGKAIKLETKGRELRAWLNIHRDLPTWIKREREREAPR
jgi:hypothetical protein